MFYLTINSKAEDLIFSLFKVLNSLLDMTNAAVVVFFLSLERWLLGGSLCIKIRCC